MTQIQITADARDVQGRSASRRLRRSGSIPGIIYGSGDTQMISLEHNTLWYALKKESFHTSILNITISGKSEQVILRDYQSHPFRNQVLHIDFQRVNEKEEIQMRIPLHFINEDNCIGVKTQGAHITHVINDVEIRAIAKNIPQYIEVDFTDIKAGQTIHLSNLTLPDGVSLVNLLRGGDSAVAIVAGIAEEVESTNEVVAAADVGIVGAKKTEE